MLTLPLRDHVGQFTENERPIQLLQSDQVLQLGVAALRFYAGYARLEADYEHDEARMPQRLGYDGETCLSLSEWVIIKPLFFLYVEREEARQLEASRGMGIDVFGRSSSEIAGEITVLEADMGRKAFSYPIVSVM